MRCAVQNLLGAAAILAVAGCTRPPSPGALVPAAVANDIAAGEWAPDQTEFNFPLATGSTVTELLDIDPSEGEVVFSQAGDSWAIVGATTARVVVQGATHSVPIGPETFASSGRSAR